MLWLGNDSGDEEQMIRKSLSSHLWLTLNTSFTGRPDPLQLAAGDADSQRFFTSAVFTTLFGVPFY